MNYPSVQVSIDSQGVLRRAVTIAKAQRKESPFEPDVRDFVIRALLVFFAGFVFGVALVWLLGGGA